MAVNGYESIPYSNFDVYVKIMPSEEGDDLHNVRLFVNYPDNDLLLTFEDLDLREARTLKEIFKKCYLNVHEQWTSPFEFDEVYEEDQGNDGDGCDEDEEEEVVA